MINTLNLRLERLPFTDTNYFPSTFLDYLAQKPYLDDYYGAFPKLENFAEVLKNRNFPMDNRPELVRVINEQYHGLVLSGKLIRNLTQLKKSTCFTVTTGHQLNIFTGPLYFLYKIVSTINACRALKQHYPDYDFVPVYWMATEDHDFEEINHFHLFGKEYTWQTTQDGAVGRFDPKGLKLILDEIPECPQFIKDAYLNSDTLAQATRSIVNELFGDYGLVIIDGDHPDLKKLFIPVIQDELVHHHAYGAVLDTSDRMQETGLKTLVTPREINLFYLTAGMRQRIVKKDGRYEVLLTDLSFSEKEIKFLLKEHPECFSPNVVLRTLYQEVVLPNLAYVGGPGELSYWLQFKSSFDHYNVPFPVLLPRNSALIINKGLSRKFQKLNLKVTDLFQSAADLKQLFLERNSEHHLDLKMEQKYINDLYKSILKKAVAVDGSLAGFIKAEENNALKNLHKIEKRIKKSEEQRQEVFMNQLMGLKDKLFPNGNLQERHDNFLNFYLNNPLFIEELIEHLDPFDFSFHVMLDDG